MKKAWAAGLSLFLIAGCAEALDLRINNHSAAEASFAFSYLDKDEGKWMVAGWYNIKPFSDETVVLNTDNALYYLYAELSNGRRIEAAPNQGAHLVVYDGSFIYDQEKMQDQEKKVGFVRAQANRNQAVINLN